MDALRSLCKWNTHEFLGFASVLDSNIGFSSLVGHLEGEVLDIGLHFDIVELATNETLGIEDAENACQQWKRQDQEMDLRVVRVHGDLVLRGITNETLSLRERDVGGGSPVTLIVGDDLDTIVLPDADATRSS